MSEFPKFTLAFGIRSNRAEAFEFYHRAFGATKISEEGSPEDEANHLIFMVADTVTRRNVRRNSLITTCS